MLSVIIPVYNEEGVLNSLIEAITPILQKLVAENEYELIFVDNGSVDGSVSEIKAAQASIKSIRLIQLLKPDYGEALRIGLLESRFEWAFIINVDFWDPGFLAWAWSMRESFDYFIGSKRADLRLNHQQVYRKLLSWGLNFILKNLLGSPTTDTHGQKLLHTKKLRNLINECKMRRGQFDTELTLRAVRKGFRIAEAPVPIIELRKPRNLMIQKILRNINDISILAKHMHGVDFEKPHYYKLFTRSEIDKVALEMLA